MLASAYAPLPDCPLAFSSNQLHRYLWSWFSNTRLVQKIKRRPFFCWRCLSVEHSQSSAYVNSDGWEMLTSATAMAVLSEIIPPSSHNSPISGFSVWRVSQGMANWLVGELKWPFLPSPFKTGYRIYVSTWYVWQIAHCGMWHPETWLNHSSGFELWFKFRCVLLTLG